MRRADRLFDIIQILRGSSRPVTADAMASRLEVTPRTIYRDIASLQASRVPIEGAAGIGYIIRPGFDLPPVMFTVEEIDAIVVGARLVRRIGDPGLTQAAETVLSKVTTLLPEALRPHLTAPPFFVPDSATQAATVVDPGEVRDAIHRSRKLRIAYDDGPGSRTDRKIWPLAVVYYVGVTLIAAWCELRRDYRHFRIDRIAAMQVLEDDFSADAGRARAGWHALQEVQRAG
jgi:predicted DNA-binding transcriptional regulator YafY